MRKKDLLNAPETECPWAHEFKHDSDVLAKAQLFTAGNRPTLNIDLYTVETLLDEDKYLQQAVHLGARYFADAEDMKFITWMAKEDEWRVAGINNIARLLKGELMDQQGNYWWRPAAEWDYATDEDADLAGAYLQDDVARWENRIRSNRYYTGISRKQRRINEMMDECIPDIPEGFYTWMHETIFGREYLYQTKADGKTEMYCTACAAGWQQEKGLRAAYTACPKCGKKVLATFRQKHESKEEQLFLLQKCDGDRDEWVERAFRAKAFWGKGHQRFIKLDERIRIIIPDGENWGKCYYEIGMCGGQPEYFDTNPASQRIKAGYLYPGNLDETKGMWQQELRHSGIEKLATETVKANINRLIICAEDWDFMEYLVKGRFYRLAQEIINDSPGLSFGMLDRFGSRSPMELMQIGPSQVDRLRQQNGGFIMLSWLQYEWDTGQKVSAETLAYFEKHGIKAVGRNISMALEYLSPNRLVHYLQKQMEKSRTDFFEGMLNTYCDYLDMARKQKLNLSSEIFYKPKDLNAAHDACVLEGQKHEIEDKAAGILEKFPNLPEVFSRIRSKYGYSGEKYCIVVPGCVEDIIREGRSLGHCIDTTDRYFDRISQDISYLVFLRKTDAKGTPWYTLEIEPGGTVRQQRTTGNNQDKKEVEQYMPFIREWQQEVRKRITEDDQNLAARSKETRLKEYKELREQQEKVWHGKLAGKLLADVLEADLVESA